MKRVVIVTWTVATVFAIVLFDLRGRAQGNALVYADFETVADNRPVSARGGLVQLVTFQEDVLHKATFKGLENANPPAPELVRITKDDPNKAMKFDFAIQAPNQWAGVGVEIHGLPDKDGKPVSDDVSGYKTFCRCRSIAEPGPAILRLGGHQAASGSGSRRRVSTGHLQEADLAQPAGLLRRVPSDAGDGRRQQRRVREVSGMTR